MTSLSPRLNQSGLLFVPRRWQRAAVLRWLKRIHAWTGFWGALLFLLMGTSGFFLNHRATLKIDTGEPVEVSRIDIPVAPGAIASADALGQWAKRTLKLAGEARPPRGEGGRGPEGRPGREGRRGGDGGGEGGPPAGAGPRGGETRRFMGRTLPEAEKWTRAFTYAGGRVTVDYVPGANHVSARTEANNLIGTIKNMHKGVGLGTAWVLFIDTIAGALVTMSLTGFLLWTRLHGSRLLAGGILLGCLAWAAFAIGPIG